jgi:hypothetical protein
VRDAAVPFLWRDGASNWGLEEWSESSFIDRFGDEKCAVSAMGRPVSGGVSMTYREFAQRGLSQRLYAFTRSPNTGLSSRILDSMNWPNLFVEKRELVKRYTVFFGRDGTGALPHAHGETFNVLCRGTKDWIVFDASPGTAGEALQRYYYSAYPYSQRLSSSEWLMREGHALHEFAIRHNMPVWRFTQTAGDVVFIPRLFSHAVINTSQVLGVALELA